MRGIDGRQRDRFFGADIHQLPSSRTTCNLTPVERRAPHHGSRFHVGLAHVILATEQLMSASMPRAAVDFLSSIGRLIPRRTFFIDILAARPCSREARREERISRLEATVRRVGPRGSAAIRGMLATCFAAGRASLSAAVDGLYPEDRMVANSLRPGTLSVLPERCRRFVPRRCGFEGFEVELLLSGARTYFSPQP